MRGSSPRMTICVWGGPGSEAHHAVKNGALRCVRGTRAAWLHRNRVELVFAAHLLDMGAHGGGGGGAVAAHDGGDGAVVLEVGFREPSEIAKLGAAERLHPHPRRQRHLGDVAVLRAGIDRVVKTLVDVVKALRISGMAQ